MEVLPAHRHHCGTILETPWSQAVRVSEVLYSVKINTHIFHGIKAINLDMAWDWSTIENLLWVLEDEGGLELWRGSVPQSAINRNYSPEYVIGDYQSITGNVFWGIKWLGFECPVWVLEDDLTSDNINIW